MKKSICLIIVVLLLSLSFTPGIVADESSSDNTIYVDDDGGADYTRIHYKIENGSLSGFVNDSFFNPIEGALVSIKCGGLHMQNISDSNGFYYIDNVPIVDCYWNVSASKKEYETFWVEMSIDINSTYDFVLTPLGNTLYVGGSGTGNYTTIQSAIDDASDGDTVFVYSGTYYENVVADKSINLEGEDRNSTIIEGNGSGDVVRLFADWVIISGFSIQNSGIYSFPDVVAGLYVHSNYNIFKNNIILNNSHGIAMLTSNNNICSNNSIINNIMGIFIDDSLNNVIIDNIIKFNSRNGISAKWKSLNHTIRNNKISNNNRYGIELSGLSKSIISENDIINNTWKGIIISESDNNVIIDNNINNNSGGIYLYDTKTYSIKGNNINNNYNTGIEIDYYSTNIDIIDNNIKYNGGHGIESRLNSDKNNISSNDIRGNKEYGIDFWYIRNNVISKNNISFNFKGGIHLHYYSTNINIKNNNIKSNLKYGIKLVDSYDNKINSNNFIFNVINVYFQGSMNNDYDMNYWNRPRLLPYPIFGKIDSELNIVWDRNPRLLPNNIGGDS